jgi:hypothetical protein
MQFGPGSVLFGALTPQSGGAITSLTTFGNSGPSTLLAGVLNIPVYGPGTVTGANDGLTSDGTTVKLGQSTGALGDPAKLLENRDIPLNGFNLLFRDGGIIINNPSNPAILYHSPAASTYYLERAYTSSLTNLVPFERFLDANPNGGPPDDNVYIQGWNIDSRTVTTQPSWTTRLEYQFVGDFYEYHLQWSNAAATITERLMSFTFVDHGSLAGDQCLTFFKNTGFEMRTLFNDNPHWSTSNNIAAGIDSTVITRASNDGTLQVRDTVNATVPNISTILQAGVLPYLWQNFSSYQFQGNAADGSLSLFIGYQPAPYGLPGPALGPTAGGFVSIFDPVVTSVFSGDDAKLIFSPANSVGFPRGYINLSQGDGQMHFHVQAGGYFFSWDQNGVQILALDANGLLTGTPGGSGAGSWRMGTVIAGVFTVDLTHAVEVNINGALTRLAVLN